MDYAHAPPPVKFLHRNKLVIELEKLARAGPLNLELIGPPGSGKTTLLYWLAVDVLMARDGLSYGDAAALIRANHPKSIPELINMFYRSVNCEVKLPIFFLDDAIPNWFIFNTSGRGRAFWSSFQKYHRVMSDLFFVSAQTPTKGITPERSFRVRKAVSRHGRVVPVASRLSRYVDKVGNLKFNQSSISLPWRRDYAMPPDVAGDVEESKRGMMGVMLKPKQLEMIIAAAIKSGCPQG